MTTEFTTTTRRNAIETVIQATVLYHFADETKPVRQDTGAIDWAISYASTYYDRGEWTKTGVRLIEVVVSGNVIASYVPRSK